MGAYSICELYLARWSIEVFFKEIKQTLQLADFLGTCENAIKWQIWTALLTYLLLRLNAWIGGWKRSFRRFFTLVKGVLWNQKRLSSLIALIGKKEQETSPSIRLSCHPNAIRFRQHLSGKTQILQKRFFKMAAPHAEKGLLNPLFRIFMGFLCRHMMKNSDFPCRQLEKTAKAGNITVYPNAERWSSGLRQRS